ncbi:MAG: acyltransferase family protein [Limisphaerales bacterium]
MGKKPDGKCLQKHIILPLIQIKISENQRAFGPDLIRATAIVLVLLSHTFPGGTMFPIIGVVRNYWGVWGVEIFFVLSGYLIGGILITNLHDGRLNSLGGALSFWKRRWFRTLPDYYLFFVLFLLIARFDEGRFPLGWEKFLWFGQALLSTPQEFFNLAWSLSVEEWFYILFPILLLILSKLIAKREHVILAAITIFLIAPVIVRCFLPADSWDSGVRKVTLPRLDSITYGVCLAFLKNHRAPIWNLMIKSWPIGIIAVVGLFGHACLHTVFLGYFTSDSVIYRVFYFCFISTTIALLFPRIVSMTTPTGWWATIIRKLSLWSYSIYLSHVFFLWLIMKGFKLLDWPLYPGGA